MGRESAEGFGDLLRRFRLAAGLSQEALAERAGLSAHGISDLERGARTRPYRDTIQRLAEGLELTDVQRSALIASARPGQGTDFSGASGKPGPALLGPVDDVEGILVGREHELGLLADRFNAASAGSPQVVLVLGEGGIGKTRLAAQFLASPTAQRADILTGRAFESGGRLPYQPLVDALRTRLERESAVDKLLSTVWLAELARLLPELSDRYPDLPVPVGDEAVARTRLFEAVVRLGQALATPPTGPVVLFVDDVQWADTATLDVLHYVARRWTEVGASVLVLLNARVEALAADPAFAEWLAGLDRDLNVTRIPLSALGVEATEALVRRLGIAATEDSKLVEPSHEQFSEIVNFARWLFAETGGQPFFVTETIKTLSEQGALVPRPQQDGTRTLELQPSLLEDLAREAFLAPGVREVLRARLARLSPAAATLLVAAAVLGQGSSFELLALVAELDEEQALRGHTRLITERGDWQLPVRARQDP